MQVGTHQLTLVCKFLTCCTNVQDMQPYAPGLTFCVGSGRSLESEKTITQTPCQKYQYHKDILRWVRKQFTTSSRNVRLARICITTQMCVIGALKNNRRACASNMQQLIFMKRYRPRLDQRGTHCPPTRHDVAETKNSIEFGTPSEGNGRPRTRSEGDVYVMCHLCSRADTR